MYSMAEQMIMETKVERGAQYLDESYPDWYTKINVDQFNLSDADHCICGQLFLEKIEELMNEDEENYYADGFDYANENLGISMINHGFLRDPFLVDRYYGPDIVNVYSYDSLIFAQYDYMGTCWIEKIQKRLAEDGLMLGDDCN